MNTKKKSKAKPKWYRERKPVFIDNEAHKLVIRAASLNALSVKDYLSQLIKANAEI